MSSAKNQHKAAHLKRNAGDEKFFISYASKGAKMVRSLPAEQSAWKCPICRWSLSQCFADKMCRNTLLEFKRRHRKEKHPECTKEEWLRLAIRTRVNVKGSITAANKGAAIVARSMQWAREAGHHPIPWIRPRLQQGRLSLARRALCTRCTTILDQKLSARNCEGITAAIVGSQWRRRAFISSIKAMLDNFEKLKRAGIKAEDAKQCIRNSLTVIEEVSAKVGQLQTRPPRKKRQRENPQ